MSDETSKKSIVSSRQTDLIASGAGGNRLIRRAASDALVSIQNMMGQMATTLHRVGTREFHDEDFRQLQVWASELGRDGQLSEFVKAINKEFTELIDERNELVLKFIENNSMQWCHDGRIRIFVRIGADYRSFPRLPKLTHLCWFDEPPSNTIDLSSVPALTDLRCANNQLTELDLASVPALKRLSCDNNQLTELDLSSIPALTELWCANNQLTELDLASVPALTRLSCDNNQLTELDLSSVPGLTSLFCSDNQLTELDIRGCLQLESVTVDPWVVVHKRADQTIVRLE